MTLFLSGGFIDEQHKESTYLDRAELIRKDNVTNKKKIIELILEMYR